MSCSLLRRLCQPRGATVLEYLIGLLLVGLLILGLVKVFGSTIQGRMDEGHEELTTLNPDGTKSPAVEGQRVAKRSGYERQDEDNQQKARPSSGKRALRPADDQTPQARQQQLIAEHKQKHKKAGLNPLIILIMLVLIGVLVYVMIKGNNGST